MNSLAPSCLTNLAGYYCVDITCGHSQHVLREKLLCHPEPNCELGYSGVTQRGSVNCCLTNKGGTVTVQGSLLQVFPVEVVLRCYVVANGSGLHHLHPINLHHWHLLKQQGST